MRFLLALIVFSTHLQWATDLRFPFLQLNELHGQSAVFGFFLISGVSVAHSYEKRPAGYYARRFLRIYPLYIVAVVFAQSLVLLVGSKAVLANWEITATGWKTAAANMLMLQGFAATSVTYNLPLWSLSFEAFYYMLPPLLFRVHSSVILCSVACSMVLFCFPQNFLFGYGALKYAWPWLAGFLLAKNKSKPLAACLCALGCVLIYFSQNQTWGCVTFAATAAAVLTASHVHLSRPVQTAFNYLGEISYPFYLFHAPLLILCYMKLGVRDASVFFALILLSTAALDWLFDKKLKSLFWEPLVQRAIGMHR